MADEEMDLPEVRMAEVDEEAVEREEREKMKQLYESAFADMFAEEVALEEKHKQ